MMEQEDLERLAVAQAVYKAVADIVSTRNPDGMRAEADRQLMAAYGQMGVKSIDLRIAGQKVGTYSVTMAKAVPEKQDARLDVEDHGKLVAWLRSDTEALDSLIEMYADQYAQALFSASGEVPDGCEAVTVATPAQPEHPKGTALRVDTQKVAQALRGNLPQAVSALLEGGADA